MVREGGKKGGGCAGSKKGGDPQGSPPRLDATRPPERRTEGGPQVLGCVFGPDRQAGRCRLLIARGSHLQPELCRRHVIRNHRRRTKSARYATPSRGAGTY